MTPAGRARAVVDLLVEGATSLRRDIWLLGLRTAALDVGDELARAVEAEVDRRLAESGAPTQPRAGESGRVRAQERYRLDAEGGA